MSVYSNFPAEWGSAANPTPPTAVVKHSYSGSQTAGIGNIEVVFGGFKITRRGTNASWQSGGDTIDVAGPIWDLQRIDLATGLGVSVFQQRSPWGGTDPDPTPLAGGELGPDGEILVPTEPGYAYILYSAFSSQHNPGTYYAGNLSESVGGGSGSGAKSGSELWFLPLPPPIPGPILTLRNKTGHFHSSGPVELEFAAYTNGGTESAPKEIQLTIDSATQTVTDFPHIETVSGDGLHEVVAIGLDEDDNESSITYRFSIGTNDWSPEHLTPIKSLRYTGTENSIVNVYTENANLTTCKFTDLFGAGNVCYANANTSEIVGESAYSYTRTGAAIAGSAQSQGGWESFEIYPDKIVGSLALGYADWLPDSIWMNIKDTTDNTSQAHSFAPPNSPWFSTSSRTGYSGAVDVEIPYTFKDGHSYEMEMYGNNQSGGHTWPLHSAGPDHGGKYIISNLSVNTFNLDVAFSTNQDTQNKHAEVSYLNTDTGTMIPFDLVVNQPQATDLDYLMEQRQKDHEMRLFICSYDPVVVEDECTIPTVVKEHCSLTSLPDANNIYKFNNSGLIGRVQAKQIENHSITQQYYHLHFQPSDRHQYGKLEDNNIVYFNINPRNTDTTLTIELFNSCGSKYSEDFDILFDEKDSNQAQIGGGGDPSGNQMVFTPSVRTASMPNYHSLIVER